jgi:hypothetical protein
MFADIHRVQPNLALSLPALKAERRRQPRYKLTDVIEVYVAGRDGRFLGWGTLRDISEAGACIHMDDAVAVGQVVDLINSRGRMVAVCRHVNPGYTGFVMGFKFLENSDLHDGCEWSPLPATW